MCEELLSKLSSLTRSGVSGMAATKEIASGSADAGELEFAEGAL
jgi:hypothetical protein